jgi:hypothetical protein
VLRQHLHIEYYMLYTVHIFTLLRQTLDPQRVTPTLAHQILYAVYRAYFYTVKTDNKYAQYLQLYIYTNVTPTCFGGYFRCRTEPVTFGDP